jgi:putative membrane protein
MKRELISAVAITLMGLAAPQAMAAADPSVLLNKANVINYEEIQMARTARDKAGDNQGLTTFADTLEADHKANEDAVAALARQKGIKLESTPASADAKVKELDNLSGGAFNEAFLKAEIADHEKAIALFEQVRSQDADDPDMELYIGETIPVMKAHLEMAKDLREHLTKTSTESPANNRKG